MKYLALVLSGFAGTLLVWLMFGQLKDPHAGVPGLAGFANQTAEPVDSPNMVAPLPELERARVLLAELESVELPNALPIGSVREPTQQGTPDLSTWNIPDRVFCFPNALRAGEWHGHADLNPKGAEIPASAVTAFEALHACYIPTLEKLAAAVRALPNQEVASLASSGKLRPLRYSNRPAAIADMERVKKDNATHGLYEEPLFTASFYYEDADGLQWFARLHGNNYGASTSDLQQYCEGMRAVAESSYGFYMRLLVLAHQIGTIDTAHLERHTKTGTAWLRQIQATFPVRR